MGAKGGAGMIHHSQEALIGERLKESFTRYDEGFPYVAFDSDFDRYAGREVPWHWHDQFEFVTVYRGVLEVSTPDETLLLKAGQGYFINAGVLHLCRAWRGRAGMALRAQLFDRALVAGADAIERRYVSPVVGSGLTIIALEGDAVQALESAFRAAQAEPPGYELLVAAGLCQAWQGLYQAARGYLAQAARAPRADTLRVKEILRFIRRHYGEDIGAKEMAEAAGVCQREVFRCFRTTLGTTPLASLTEHRIAQAARMLAETEETITQIAVDCGFGSPSYFARVFGQRMGCTPGAYRERSRGNR